MTDSARGKWKGREAIPSQFEARYIDEFEMFDKGVEVVAIPLGSDSTRTSKMLILRKPKDLKNKKRAANLEPITDILNRSFF